MYATLHEVYEVFTDLHGGAPPSRTKQELFDWIRLAGLRYEQVTPEFLASLFTKGWAQGPGRISDEQPVQLTLRLPAALKARIQADPDWHETIHRLLEQHFPAKTA